MNFAFAGFRHGHLSSFYKKISATNNTVIGCWEDFEEAKLNAQKNLGADFKFDTYEDLLSDKNIDIVVIGNYYAKRGENIIDALKAGKNVIADKPICTSLSELDKIEKLSKERGLKVGCMLDLRNSFYADAAKKIVDEGKLGEIYNIQFEGQHPLNYDKRPKWYFEDGKHGGTINDIGIHGIDLVRYITGLELKRVIAARCWNAYATEAENFKDSAQFMVELSNSAGLTADVSYASPCNISYKLPFNWRFVFWGTKGVMEFSEQRKSLYIAYHNSDEPVIIKEQPVEHNFLQDFLDEIDGKNTTLNTKEVIASARTALTIQAAAN